MRSYVLGILFWAALSIVLGFAATLTPVKNNVTANYTRMKVGEHCKLFGIVVMVFEVNTPTNYNINATVLRKNLTKIHNVHESLLMECGNVKLSTTTQQW